MRRHGACGLAKAQHTDPFKALVRAIISQQLSTKAAATIAARVDALFDDGHPTPAAFAAISDEQLARCGLSAQKVRYIRDSVCTSKKGRCLSTRWTACRTTR